MGKSKHRKDHKKKVLSRKSKISQEKSKLEKAKREFIMNLIKEEQKKGMFENNQTLSTDIPQITIEGPSI